MTNNNNKKHLVLTDEDIKIIKSDPEGLADYVIRQKVRESRKTMLIITILVTVASFVLGTVVGGGWTRESIPNNVVQIKISEEKVAEFDSTELEK